MKKLLKLINEYEEEGIIFDEVDDEECFVDIHPCTLWTEYNGHLWFNNANKVQFDKWMFDKIAISKEYGFIKWLVDNDKIDYDKVDKSWNDEMSFVDFKLDNIMEIRVKVVLMLLSISDTPIDDLISYLR